MFKYSENRQERKEVICKIAEINPGAGLILAAADFEWTLNRCILALGKSPTVTLRDELHCPKNTGINTQKQAWKREIKVQSLITLFDKWAEKHDLPTIAWSDIKTATYCRNQLVHGVRNNIDDNTARAVIYIFETACDTLCEFAKSRRNDIYGRLHPRPRLKGEAKTSKTTEKISKVNAQLKSIVERYKRSGKI